MDDKAKANPKGDSRAIVLRNKEVRAMNLYVRAHLLKLASGDKAPEETKRLLSEDIDRFAEDLAPPTASRAERQLAEIAALDWFALRLHQGTYFGAMNDGGQSFVQSEHNQRRIDRTHRRLMMTLRTLATVRRLGAPAVQVNLAHQQVNVAGDVRNAGAADILL